MTARILPFVLALAFVSYTRAQQPSTSPTTVPQGSTRSIPEAQLREVLSILEREYFRSVSREELAVVARDRNFGSLDPYSKYMDPATAAEFDQDLRGAFGGIGIRLDETPAADGVRVIGPLWNSPAFAAGVRAGDVIVAIDGGATRGAPLDAVRAKLQGRPGSSVTIETRHDGSAGMRRLTIARAIISTSSVLGARRDPSGAWDYMLEPGGAAYVRITSFSQTVVADFDAALKGIEKEGATSLVVDLRGNVGGLSNAAIAIADRLLDAGRIVSFKGRGSAGSLEVDVRDATPGVRTAVPIALLISPTTISAAELLAAALQDHHRAVVVGARTYGKGTSQKVFPLERQGGAVLLTVALYERPSGVPIERHMPGAGRSTGGVEPDPGLAIAASPQQWTQWEHALMERDAIAEVAHGITQPSPASLVSPLDGDPVLAKALEALRLLRR